MCGIAGVLYFDGRPVDQTRLKRMGEAIAHRGPDAEGYFLQPGIGLVHRRLSIIDLEGGDQPIANEDKSVHVVFNGEIYNYKALRRVLIQRGHRFATNSDTETLVHAYEDKGVKLANCLRGMFAFAIWDARSKRLVLGRDPVGQKPLYYYRDDTKLVFGSEIKAILAHGEIDKTIDYTSIDMYMCLGVTTGSNSIYRKISKLLPAHVLSFETDGTMRTNRYWKYEPSPSGETDSCDIEDSVREKVRDAVSCHLVSDVPIGGFLSGGIDSTVVCSLAAEIMSTQLSTFCIGFEGVDSETGAARATSARIESDHHESIVDIQAASDLDKLVHHYDEPFADSSAIPTMRVSELAAKQVKVVVSGDGGDECFGGYSRYVYDIRESSIRRMIPSLGRHLIRPVASAWPQYHWLPRILRGKSFLTNVSSPPALAYAQTIATSTNAVRQQLYSASMRDTLVGWNAERELADHFSIDDRDPLSGMLQADINTLLPDAFLVKVDRASMAVGLEVRPPLIDHELLALSARVPSGAKIRNGETKSVFKKAFAEYLPDSLTCLPKRGFEIPLNSWFQGSLSSVYRDTVLAPNAPITQVFHPAQVTDLLTHHISGKQSNGQLLWNVLVLAKWIERYEPTFPSH